MLHIRNLVKAVNSKDLVYNFDTGELKENVRLRRLIDSGKVEKANRGSRPLPVFGDYDRVYDYWIPLMKKYTDRINQQAGQLNLVDLPRDAKLSVAKYLNGKDLLALCLLSFEMNTFCDDNAFAIFRRKIIDDYPMFDVDQIPIGSEREAYFELAQGGKVNIVDLNLNARFTGSHTVNSTPVEGFKSIKQVKINTLRIGVNVYDRVLMRQTGGLIYSFVLPRDGQNLQNPLRLRAILGRDVDQDALIPLKVVLPDGELVKKIESAKGIVFLLTESGNIYRFGGRVVV